MSKQKPIEGTLITESSLPSLRLGAGIPLEFHVPDELEDVTADHLFSEHDGHEVVLSFFKTRRTLVASAEQARAVKKVPAVCVARITIAASRLPDFVKVLIAAAQHGGP